MSLREEWRAVGGDYCCTINDDHGLFRYVSRTSLKSFH